MLPTPCCLNATQDCGLMVGDDINKVARMNRGCLHELEEAVIGLPSIIILAIGLAVSVSVLVKFVYLAFDE